MEWKYLESEPFYSRHILAAYHLKGCKNILEVGGYKTPITQFLQGDHESVTVVDPLAKPYYSSTLNNRHCEIKHLAIKIEEYKPKGNEDGFLFLGIEGLTQDAINKIIDIMRKCKVNIIEFPPSWMPSAESFNKILESRFFNVRERVILDLSENNFGDLTDSYEPHPFRHMFILVPKEDLKASDLGEITKWINISRGYLVLGSCSKTLNLAKIRLFLKKCFPFIRYRWYVYDALKKIPYPSFTEVRHFLYYKRSEKVGQKDLSQEISLTKNCKLEIEPLSKSNRNAVREFADQNHNNDLHSLRIRQYYINTYEGFIASIRGEIIGHIWYWAYNHNLKPPEEFRFYNLKLGKEGVYLFDFYIAPEYRGGGNAIEFLSRFFLELKKLGYSRTAGVHNPNNLAARWTYKVVGEKDAKTLNMHIFFNTIAYYDKAIFLKKWRQDDPCTSRMLLSFRSIF